MNIKSSTLFSIQFRAAVLYVSHFVIVVVVVLESGRCFLMRHCWSKVNRIVVLWMTMCTLLFFGDRRRVLRDRCTPTHKPVMRCSWRFNQYKMDVRCCSVPLQNAPRAGRLVTLICDIHLRTSIDWPARYNEVCTVAVYTGAHIYRHIVAVGVISAVISHPRRMCVDSDLSAAMKDFIFFFDIQIWLTGYSPPWSKPQV